MPTGNRTGRAPEPSRFTAFSETLLDRRAELRESPNALADALAHADAQLMVFTSDHIVARRTDIPGNSRALGWDTMLPASSCGSAISPRAFGHTGFTGTSLWIDPDRAVYTVLLTNRVHPSRTNDAIKQIRPAVHDAVMRELGSG